MLLSEVQLRIMAPMFSSRQLSAALLKRFQFLSPGSNDSFYSYLKSNFTFQRSVCTKEALDS